VRLGFIRDNASGNKAGFEQQGEHADRDEYAGGAARYGVHLVFLHEAYARAEIAMSRFTHELLLWLVVPLTCGTRLCRRTLMSRFSRS
jgi:hypothetical protein